MDVPVFDFRLICIWIFLDTGMSVWMKNRISNSLSVLSFLIIIFTINNGKLRGNVS